jgi:hypothetical protein
MNVAAGAFAEGVQVIAEEGGSLEGFAAAGVEDVGGGEAAAGGEGGGVGVEGIEAHADDAGAGVGDAEEFGGEFAFGLGIEQAAGDIAEELFHAGEAGEGFVMEAGDEQGFFGVGGGGEPGQTEEVGAGEDGAVIGNAPVEVGHQGGGADAVAEPAQLVVGGDGMAAINGLLDAQEVGGVALVHGEEMDVHAVDGLPAGGQGVFPGVVALGAGGEEIDGHPPGRGVEREVLQQRLGAAHRALAGEARADEGEAVRRGHGRWPFPVRRGAFRGRRSARRTVLPSLRAR